MSVEELSPRDRAWLEAKHDAYESHLAEPAGLVCVDPPKGMRAVVPVPPHEETWYAEKQSLVRKRAPKPDSMFAFLEDAVEDGEGGDIARARLASAAPDMARVLLACEWADNSSEEYAPECPSCHAQGPYEGEPSKGHAPDCALDASLRKAGVR